MAIILKNTFLDIDYTSLEAPVRRRSASVPPAFKPCGFTDEYWHASPCSDDSTSASDKETGYQFDLSDNDSQDGNNSDCNSHSTPSVDTPEECCSVCDGTNQKSKVTLSLVDMVVDADGCSRRSKLRSRAEPFQSIRQTPGEVKTIIECAVEAIRGGQDIADVQVCDGGMGGTTMIVGQSCSTSPDASWIFPLVKDTLLSSAEQSESTYIIGYKTQPFNYSDALSFSLKIARIPAAHQKTACWDTYETGHCPRCSSCRWTHPTEMEMMNVIVVIRPRSW